MTVASGLVDGAGPAGIVAALAVARAGLEVTLVTGGATASLDVDAALHLLGEEDVAPEALARRLREYGVEVRPDTRLVGSVVVDRHVEVELSDGRVENHDVVVVVGGDADTAPWQILASDLQTHPVVVDDVIRTLAGIAV